MRERREQMRERSDVQAQLCCQRLHTFTFGLRASSRLTDLCCGGHIAAVELNDDVASLQASTGGRRARDDLPHTQWNELNGKKVT